MNHLDPGSAAVVNGEVVHARSRPKPHRFTITTSYLWIDPDRPDELLDAHPWWSSSKWHPVQFRADDYGSRGSSSTLAQQARAAAGVDGPVRMLTQPRRLGWLFNPITIYVVWREPTNDPVAAVLEVTNTPWKERHHYVVPLQRSGDWLRAAFDKQLHVSPFLEMDYRYAFRFQRVDDRLVLHLDVFASDDSVDDHDDADVPILRTSITGRLTPPSRSALSSALLRQPWSTFAVSAGIHWHAARLWLKKVPVVHHPRRKQ